MSNVLKIQADSVKHIEQLFRRVVVTLRPSDNIGTFAADRVNDWHLVQGRIDIRLKKGDRVTLVSHDGLTIHDQCVVTKAEAGRVWLGKPLRIVSLESDVMFTDGSNEVVACGTQFGFATSGLATLAV